MRLRALLIHSAGEEAAVDDEHLAVDEAGGFRSEEDGGSGQLLDAAEASEGGAELELVAACGAVEPRRCQSIRDGVYSDAAAPPRLGLVMK